MRRFMGYVGISACALSFMFPLGCAQSSEPEVVTIGSPAMLFDVNRASEFAATGFGRRPWPSAPGRLESLEETVFVEYYRDYQGSATLERSNPHQWFRSYRAGSQLR